jgi:hypothetical protein
MRLNHGLHLAYCANVHRGETWPETLDALTKYTLAVRERVCPQEAYAIGLRLSNRAAMELSEPAALLGFQRWLEQHNCYVFTINGFPFGQFHGTRVKEQVYLPDWTSPERLAYTNRLFDLLGHLVAEGVEGSVSTVPCGFKELVKSPDENKMFRHQLWSCIEHIEGVSARTGRKLHLGLEPEPLCVLETSAEAIEFFEQMRADRPNDSRLGEYLGVNYDTCHLAVEFEEPHDAISALQSHGIKISKLHLSSALKVSPTPEARQALAAFADDVYLHQVIIRRRDGSRTTYRDLKDALVAEGELTETGDTNEWRIHFHVPLHSPPTKLFDTTADHLLGVLDLLQVNPLLCSHLEMETYTWEVLPASLKNRNVVDQLVGEYEWTLARLEERGLGLRDHRTTGPRTTGI